MKKVLIIMSILIMTLVLIKDDSIIIPENAIRFRVIANSNSIDDQIIKNDLSINLEKYISLLIKNDNDPNTTILNNYNNINNYITNYLKDNKINTKYKLNIGKNYFPKKEFKGIKYNEGYYDSIVVSLGQEQGLNWWCVIYPPLCLINENVTDKEYTTLASEIINKL